MPFYRLVQVGQNVNKVATAIQLRFNTTTSPSLPENVRDKLIVLARNRINKEGVLVIEASNHRTQEENRQEALDRLVYIIQQAAIKLKPRIQTRPSKRARQKRLMQKRLKSTIKNLRSRILNYDD